MRPPAAAPRIVLHAHRSRQSARRRSEPFNLTAGGRGPRLPLTGAANAAPVGWVGPWVELGAPGVGRGRGRLALYAPNEWGL